MVQAEHADQSHSGITPAVYIKVWLALLVLLVVTSAIARADLGPLNIMVAVGIAIFKAVLIILYFMHVRVASLLVRVFVASAFIWLSILFVFTLTDYISRDWLTTLK